MRVENIESEKRVCNIIFLIVTYEYNRNGFLLWRDSMSNMYADIGIWNLYFEYMICEIDQTRVKYFLMGLSSFIHVYIWPSEYLAHNYMWVLQNICSPICNWSCYRATSSQCTLDVPNYDRWIHTWRDCVIFWLSSQQTFIFYNVQV